MNSSGNATTESIHPAVKWAQRKDRVFITIEAENCSSPTIDVTASAVHYKATVQERTYEVKMDLFSEIAPEASSRRLTGREVFFTLKKKEGEYKYWPRLLKDSKKAHYLKTDFNRWRDEDESEGEEQEDFNLDEMMQSMGGLQGAGGADFGGAEEEDSDDEDLPDLQQ